VLGSCKHSSTDDIPADVSCNLTCPKLSYAACTALTWHVPGLRSASALLILARHLLAAVEGETTRLAGIVNNQGRMMIVSLQSLHIHMLYLSKQPVDVAGYAA